LVSRDCAHCGRPVRYGGRGRRPRYCGGSCRSGAWSLRRAAQQLGAADPLPPVVREVLERTVERERLVPVRTTPVSVQQWLPLLAQLTRQARDHPEVLARGPGDWEELAHAVRELHASLAGHAPAQDQDVSPERPVSRQQRRALERRARKHRRE
jgi:hypothetical protein